MFPMKLSMPIVDPEKKPAHVGEGLLQGVNKWADHFGTGAQKMISKPKEGLEKEGALGAAKGVGIGVFGLATGLGKGACDFVTCTLEGVRNSPDAVMDVIDKDRSHNKHGVEGDGEGDLLETYKKEEEEPAHIGEGALSGLKSFGLGLTEGVKDLTSKPMAGAKESGVAGFAKGLGQGALGFGSKTTSGSIDLATSVLTGLKNTPEAVEKRVSMLSTSSPSELMQSAASSGSSFIGTARTSVGNQMAAFSGSVGAGSSGEQHAGSACAASSNDVTSDRPTFRAEPPVATGNVPIG
eukprot:TRINITY_DN74446_c0_g1_i1.p1 TRINITY_DN74446_c0_g1~~TRINITY_DN74446_c0_g1_i1.p1  ORF type:complete len:295 (+),score=58.49 TRINITY_DN74446_c0_g1_i1:74-958(+)